MDARIEAALRRHGTAIALAVFTLTAVLGVLARPLLPIDETRYLAVAWEMWRTGNVLVPHLDGALYSHKPPLLFWLMDLGWLATGVNETTARLVSPAFGLGMIAATSLLGRRLWPGDAGIGGRAALLLTGMVGFIAYAGLTMFDTLLGLAVLLGVLALGIAAEGRRGWILLGLAIGLGVLAKGPVILVHLLPVALASPLWAGVPARRLPAGIGIALLVGLAVVALWLVPALIAGGPDYRRAVLWTQSAGRVAEAFAHARPWWFFLALLPSLLWPWIWAPAFWMRLARAPLRADPGLRLCAIWSLATLLLFSLISSKQAHYLLPALPAVALALARSLGPDRFRAPAAALLPALVGLALIGVATGLLPARDLAAAARPAWAVALTGLALIIVAAAALRLSGYALFLLGPALALAANLLFALGGPGRDYDAAVIAARIAPHDGAGIAFLGDYNGEFNFAARLQHPVAELDGLEAATAWRAAHPGGALIARLDRPRPDAPPEVEIVYRDRTYGLWLGDAPQP